MQYIFVSAIKLALGYLQIGSAKLQVQTQIMHQNVAVILQQLCYHKISFTVLVPDGMKWLRRPFIIGGFEIMIHLKL